MNSNNSLVSRRLKPKVLLVSKKKSNEKQILPTEEELIRALDVNPSDRTQKDIDTILAIVGKWKDFQTFIKMDQEKKEICRRITYERYDTNDFVIKQGDDPDGWYLILSGTCSIYILINSDFGHEAIPPSVLSTLKNSFGQEKCFLCVAKKFPSQEFGSTALTNNDKRNASILADEPSLILRVDPHLYRDTAAWVARAQLEKKANLLSHIPQLQFLRDLPPEDKIFTRLGENMIENRLETGRVINAQNIVAEDCFCVIEEGLLYKQRIVDFTNFNKNDMKINTKNQHQFPINLPPGKHTVTIKKLGPKTMFPDPTLKDYISYPFSLVVVEPVTFYALKQSDLTSMLLNAHIERIRNSVRDEPTDDEVIQMHIERQQAIQWQLFKKKCVKEVRREIKVEKQMALGQWCVRRCGVPKTIKDHKHFPPLKRVQSQND
ncbi:hypothetical protein M9Y10_030761 [Tritrichomonas musculus]|uniref:Cyclic nucleotide-binding domain-containing protein n=1 Tax=Tritrichomonas musculus TaxID=1915356 RepID=A0ABR2H472_9EUKA